MLDVRCENRVSEQGFTLIEVLVASAIIMASIGVLMQLFASGLDRTQRAGQVAHLLLAERSIMHELEVINPALQRQGKGVAEGIHYRWKAHGEVAMAPIYDPDGKLNRQLGLFEVQVAMQNDRGKRSSFTLHLIGWKDGS